ncbi:MAG: shikimate kinase [Xanthomonadales bacterium]|nr:shikimate kinase [Xanthomonadales bacterium]
MASPACNVYLIGPMGSGKTTIGQRVAKMLDLEFCDCDHELEAQTGASVSLIFDVEGEQGFRERETRMLEQLTGRRGVLVATGGGAVLKKENRDLLRRNGLVVYLSTSVAQQLRRLNRDRSRPLLQTSDRKVKLARLAAQRNPLYEELADIEFPSQNRALDVTARALADLIRSHWSQAEGEASGPTVEQAT